MFVKTHYFCILGLFLLQSMLLIAQNEKSILAPPTPDFTMASMDGDTFSLYSELDAGKIVLLDFFNTGCPTCQQNNPKLDSIWLAYGYGGDSLWVWGIETSSFDSNYVANIDTFETNFGGQFPVFSTYQNTDSVLTLYNITWTPQYYLVNPTTKIISPLLGITELDSAIQTLFQQSNTGFDNPFDKAWCINILPSEIILSGFNINMVNIRLISLSGTMIFDNILPIESGKGTLLLNGLNRGIYIVNIIASSQSISRIFYHR